MAKLKDKNLEAKKAVKKAVKKVLDKTNLDEKLVAEYHENKSLVDDILCYAKCYGGYAVAIFTGWELCKGDWIVALPALAVTAFWAWKNRKRTCTI
tara:strand:- start:5 stop:292 length:288 start_codon:yes stop_codon:yes gene_type:complete